jgi:hypothetical protein
MIEDPLRTHAVFRDCKMNPHGLVCEPMLMGQPPVIPQLEQRPSRFPLWWVLGVNCIALGLTIQFYWVPKGMPIRPMAYAFWMFVLMFAGLAGIPIVLPTLRKHPTWVWPWIVVFLSVSPFPLTRLIFDHAQHLRGFILEP